MKKCNHCNKLTEDEVAKGEIFCIECGHQRDEVGAPPQQKDKKVKKEYYKRWWYIAIWVVIIYFLFPYVRQFVNNKNKAFQMDKYSTYMNNLNKNYDKMSSEDTVDFDKVMLKSYEAIMKNLNAQDSLEFARLAELGDKLTYDEASRITELTTKASNTMSPEERRAVEQFNQHAKKLLK